MEEGTVHLEVNGQTHEVPWSGTAKLLQELGVGEGESVPVTVTSASGDEMKVNRVRRDQGSGLTFLSEDVPAS